MGKYLRLLILLLIGFHLTPSFALENDIIRTQVQGIQKIKQKILSVAAEESATTEEKATLLAIASIETEDFSSNYPAGDNKSEDAYNVSLYKMNIGMIRDIDSSVDPFELHNNIKLATQVMLHGIRKFGVNKFLTYHRGGIGAFNGKVLKENIEPYIDAIKKISKKYVEDQKQLSPKTTDDTRYTVMVPAI